LPQQQNKETQKTITLVPEEGTTILFQSALLQARSIDKIKLIQGSGAHRAQLTTVENGKLYIQKCWNKKEHK
jgi:hypothetical protein